MRVLRLREYPWFHAAKLQVINRINKVVVNIFTLLLNNNEFIISLNNSRLHMSLSTLINI
jgi:hypothetical protein